MQDANNQVEDVIRARRTQKKFAPSELNRQTLQELLTLLSWAPNHRMEEPWRCYVMDRSGIEKLDAFFEEHPSIASWPSHGKEHKLARLRSVYLANIAAIIHVTAIKDQDPVKDQENYAACAAGVQNLLLGAEARGIANFWASSPAMRHPETQAWLGVNLDIESFVGSIWLGQAAAHPLAPPRQAPDTFTTWI